MRTRAGPVAFAFTLGCLATAYTAVAQQADSVTVDVGECTELQSPEERLACYEARVDAELKRREAAPGAAAVESPADAAPAESPTDAGPVESPAEAAPASTGAQESNRSESRRDQERLEIVGIVASLTETVPKAWMITLEDGQVWRQTYPERYPLRVGQRVTLHSTRWGDSWRLTAEGLTGYGYIQVERVR